MRDDRHTENALNDFAAQLSALVPSAQLDRDQLMFAAGRRAGARQLRVFQGGLALSCTACLALATLLVAQAGREPQLAESSDAGSGVRVQEFASTNNPDATSGLPKTHFAAKDPEVWQSGDTLGNLRQSPELLLALDRPLPHSESDSPATESSAPESSAPGSPGPAQRRAAEENSFRTLRNRYLNEPQL